MSSPRIVATSLVALAVATVGCAQPQAAPVAPTGPGVERSASPPPPFAPGESGPLLHHGFTRVPPPPSHGHEGHEPGREHGDHHVYRLDFVLTAKEGPAVSPATSFTLTLAEGSHGEVVIGRNVALSSAVAGPAGGGAAPSARQDVGLKVKAQYRAVGDDLLFEITTELSALEPPSTVRKVVASGNALATPGKAALVLALDDDKRHYELTVTPTKLP
jgi:hypothetical protein